MADRFKYCVMVAVIACAILLSSQEADAQQYCTRTAYRSRAYTAYSSRPSVYYYACGWWDWGRCRGTRYHRQAYTAYRQESYRTCCSGYGYSSCHALCWGSTSCPNGGTCRGPNYCSCRTGWSGNRCTTDVNECARGSHRCHSRATCHNTHGSYTCSCNNGYTGNGFSCLDVNECSRGTDRCHRHATCHNNYGSYTCSCNTGYTGNGFSCTDVNECTRGTDRCHLHATCHNTQGSYTCSCNTGYQGNGFSCTDINECLTNNGGCNHNCHNSDGSYTCSCNNGYQLNSDGHTCEDINECLSNNGGCHHNCHNSDGSYTCSCNDDYHLNTDGHTCEVPPLPPTNLQVSGIGNRTATLTWQAPVVTFLNSLTAVSSYQVIASQEQFANVSDIYVNIHANTTTYTFPQTLEEYTAYTCTVEARNAFGLGNATQPVVLRTLQSAPSSPPQSVNGVPRSTTVLFFTWLPPPPVDINGIILYYEVDLREIETGQRWTFTALGDDLRLGSLHPYFTYQCKVAAHTVGRGPFSEPFELMTLETSPTAPPTNLSVISVNSTTMTLSWDLPPFDQINGHIQHYILVVTEWETASEFQEQPNNTQVTLKSLHPYYTYICRVAAVTTGPGPYTGNFTIQLPEDAPSEAPPNLSGYAVNSTTITLMWDTIAVENHNGIVRHYLVSVLEVDTGEIDVYTAVATQLNISGLHPYYTYICVVAAVTIRIGPFSHNVSIITPQGVPSGPPLNFSIEATTSRTLYFTWEPPLLEQQNGVILGYTVNIVSNDNSTRFQLYSDDHATNLSATIFKPYTVYRCVVAAFTTPGTGPYSDEAVILTPEDVPTKPVNTTLARVDGSPTKLYIHWKPPEEPNGIIVAYNIYCKVIIATDVQQILGSASGTSGSTPITASSGLTMSGEGSGFNDISDYVISVVTNGTESKAFVEDLTPFTNYGCFITANTSVGEGSSSKIDTATTDESTPHDAPSQFSNHVLNSTAVHLNWSAPNLPYGIIILYTLVYNASQSDMRIIPIPGNKTTNYTVQGLNEDTVYTFTVYASTRIGAGPSSETTAQTHEYYPSSPPLEVQVTYVGKREATITWQPPTFEDRNGVIVYYELIVSQSQFEIPDITVNANITSHTLTNLEEHVQYTVVVAAATRIGVGPFSSAVNFTTQQDVPSAPPQSAVGVANSPTQVTLSWSPPPHIDTNGDLQYYAARVTEVETGRQWTFYTVDTFVNVGGLHPYFNYRCRVAAHNVLGSGPFTNPFYVQTLETAPTAPPSTPQLTNLTSQSFSLMWQPPPFEEINGDIRQYTLSIVELETGWKFKVTTNETQITINSLHPFYNYLCRIRAETTQPGPYSDEISVRLLEQVPSGPPQNFSGISINSTAIALSWNVPRFEDQNGVVRHYIVNVIERQTGTKSDTVTTQMEITFSSLHPYYTYVCTVYAVTVGAGPGAEPVSVTTMEDIPNGVPRDFVAVVISSSAVNLSWQPLLPEQRNGIIIRYVVNVTTVETGEGFELVSALDRLTVDSLHPHWTYIFTVSGETGVGVGPPSLAVTATTLEDAPTLAPQDVVTTPIDSRTLMISWMPPPFEHQNGVIREYRVNITERETGMAYRLTTAATSLTVPSLHPFYTYNCTVAAFTIAEGPYSEKLSITMPEDVPSSAPRMLRVVTVSSTSTVLRWEAPPPEDLNGLLIGYSINVTKLQTGERLELFSNSTTLTVYLLQPYTVYTCVSAAVTIAGRGPFSDVLQIQTLEAAPASPPQNVTIISINSRNVHLSWSVPPLEYHNGIIRKFYINITEVDTGMKFQRISFGTSLIISSLHPFYIYWFSVAAFTVDLGPFTEPSELQMPQDAPSSPPSNYTAVALSSRSILLTWDAPPVEGQNGIITGYTVNITELETGEVSAMFTESHNLTLHPLRPFTTYGFFVSAQTVVGRGPATHFLFVTTQEEAPIGQPVNVTVLFVGPTSIHISWDHPPEDTHYGIIRQYHITYTELETGAVFNTSTDSETTQVTADSLHPFYTYMFFIVPVTVDVGTNHTEITIQTEEAAPSGPPTNVQVATIYSRQVELVWAVPPMDQQNGIIRRYIVNVTSDDSREELITYSQTTALVQNLYPFTTYFCSVSAETVAPGPFSPPVVVQTLEDAPTAPPKNLTATPLDSRTLHITWHPPVEEERNGIIRGYIINITELNSGTEYQLENASTEITIPNLHPFYQYFYSVAAITVALGPFTPGFITEMPEDAPSAAPDNITTTNVTAFSLILSWNPPPTEHQNGIIRQYVVNATEENTGREFYIMTRSPAAEFQLQSLHPHYNYTLAVAAITTDVGPFSYSVEVLTSTAPPSSEPRNFMVVNVTSTTIHFSWQPPLREDQNGIITGYLLNVTSHETGESKHIFTESTAYILYSISPFTLYTAAIAAQTSAGKGPFSGMTSVQTLEDEPSDTPQFVRYTAVTSTSVDLSWSPPPTEHHNGIIRQYTVRVVVQDTGEIFTHSTAQLSVTVGDLHPYYTYNFSISAVTVLPGPYSEPLVVRTLPDIPVGSPEITAAAVVDPITVYLTWNPPRLDEQNGIISHYLVNITATHPHVGGSFQQTCTMVSCNITHLHPYQTYQFAVSAVTIGPGPYSEIYTVTTLEAAPSTPPQNFTVEVLSSTAVFLRWSPPTPHQRNGVIRNYHIRQYETTTGILTNYTQEGNHTELVLGSLRAHNEYKFIIAAETVQLGPFSNPVTVTTLESAPSDAPSNLTAMTINSTSVYLSWLPPDEDQHNGDIRHYNIRIVERHSGRVIQLNSTDTTTVYTGLHPAYTYSFTVAAVTVEIGPYSDSATFKMPEDVPTASPQNIQAMTMNSSTVLITWLPPIPEHWNGIITAYIVNIFLDDNDTVPQQYTTSTLSVTLVGLHPFSTYVVVVAAKTGVGRGPFSSGLRIHTPEDVPSAPPQYLRRVAIVATSVTLSWQAPPEENWNGVIRFYYVFVTELESGRSFRLNSTKTNHLVANLHPYYTYNFSVAAVTVGAGPISDTITLQTSEAVPSGPPGNLATTNVTSRSITLTWDPPTAANQNGIIRSYIINMVVLESGEKIQLMTNDTKINLELLHPYYTYSFVISAVTIGPGPPSSVYSVTTDEEVPGGPPRNFTADIRSSTQILLMWQPPSNEIQNGRIRLYTVSVFEVQTDTNYSYTLYSQPSEDPALLVEPLHPYYDYMCNVSAVTIGPGPYTSPLIVRTFEDAPSGPPLGISAIALGPRVIQISWNQPLPEEQNGFIRSYTVNLTVTETGQHMQFTTNNTTVTAEGLHPYFKYHISVAAVTIAIGPYSEIYSLQTPQDVPSGTPTNVQGIATSSTSIRLTWEPPQHWDQNGVIQAYNITITEVLTGRMMYFKKSGMNFILIVNSLHPYYTYQCSISAETIGPGPAAKVRVTTQQGVPGNAPQNITIVLLHATSAAIHWDLPPFEDQNGIIELYRLFVIEIDTGRVIEQLHTENTSLMLQELQPFHVYQFAIAARTVAGLGPFSNPSFFQMPESAPGAPVHNFTVEMVYATRVQLSWLPPDPQLWNGRITNYTVVYKLLRPVGMTSDNLSQLIMTKAIPTEGNPLVNNADPRLASIPLQQEVAVVDELQEHHVYIFSVFIANAAGRSEMSMSIIQALPGAEPSGTPNTVEVHILSSTSVEVQWLPPDFIEQNGIIIGYTVILTNMETGISHEYNTSRNVTVQHIKGLQKYTWYYVRIAASTVHGTGPLSNMTVFQTYEDTPGPVRDVTVELRQGADNVTAVLSWIPPDEPNGVITQYQVFYAGYNGTHLIDGPHLNETNSQTLQHEIPGVIHGLTYHFKVCACTRVGCGNYSTSVSVIVPTVPAAIGSPTDVSGNTTDVQLPVGSTTTETAISVVAAIGWLLLLGVVVFVVLVFYRYKRRKRKYEAQGTELHVLNPTFVDAGTASGNVYESIENFQVDPKCGVDELSAVAALKILAADEGNPNFTMSDSERKDASD